jgi:4'-phosphopantetheinyl transferase
MDAWRPPAGGLPWQPDAVHVWLAMMPEGDRPVAHALSAAERERAARFRFERHRAEYIHHHEALREILSGYTGAPPESVALACGEKGKPALDPPAAWRFNLSHSGPAALVAVAHEIEVGVDIERIRPLAHAEAIAARFFAPAECAALRGLPPEQREAAFFACWTRKEALLKASGDGLSRPLSSFAVPVDPAAAGPWRVEGFTLTALPAPPGYAAALAAAGSLPPLRRWRFQR